MSIHPFAKEIHVRRKWLTRLAFSGLIVIVTGFLVGFVDSVTAIVLPKPDYYRLWFTELARQSNLLTGTPIIVKNDEDTLESFNSEYNRRNKKLGLPPGEATRPNEAVAQFTYAPALMGVIGSGIAEIPISRFRSAGTGPLITEEDTNAHPLAIWTYSERERLLATFICQSLTADHPLTLHPPRPDPRIVEPINWANTVSIQGSVPDARIYCEHAYLTPFDDPKLENLEWRAREMPNVLMFRYLVPNVVVTGHDEAKTPPLSSFKDVVSMFRAQSASRFRRVQHIVRFSLIPMGLVLLTIGVGGLRNLYGRFSSMFSRGTQAGDAMGARVGFLRFLGIDVNAMLDASIARAQAIKEEELAVAQWQTEFERLKNELERSIEDMALSDAEISRIGTAMSAGPLSELIELTEFYRQKHESEVQLKRDRLRDIQWLVSEFEAVPVLKRDSDAREALILYEKAIEESDIKVKLEGLKEARKKLPREFRTNV